MNVLLLLGTGLGVAGLLLGAIIAVAMGMTWRAVLLGALAGAWTLAYGAGVLAASLRSHDTVLPVGETKRFCGFYLDCHLGVAVVSDSAVGTIGDRRAAGSFHVLTLRLSSNAVRATLTPYDLQFDLVGPDGTRYRRDYAAEAALAGPRTSGPLEQAIPAGGSYTVTVVFDVPPTVREPKLLAREGGGVVDAVLEGVLIGDEDSFLHRKTLLALPNQRRDG